MYTIITANVNFEEYMSEEDICQPLCAFCFEDITSDFAVIEDAEELCVHKECL